MDLYASLLRNKSKHFAANILEVTTFSTKHIFDEMSCIDKDHRTNENSVFSDQVDTQTWFSTLTSSDIRIRISPKITAIDLNGLRQVACEENKLNMIHYPPVDMIIVCI